MATQNDGFSGYAGPDAPPAQGLGLSQNVPFNYEAFLRAHQAQSGYQPVQMLPQAPPPLPPAARQQVASSVVQNAIAHIQPTNKGGKSGGEKPRLGLSDAKGNQTRAAALQRQAVSARNAYDFGDRRGTDSGMSKESRSGNGVQPGESATGAAGSTDYDQYMDAVGNAYLPGGWLGGLFKVNVAGGIRNAVISAQTGLPFSGVQALNAGGKGFGGGYNTNNLVDRPAHGDLQGGTNSHAGSGVSITRGGGLSYGGGLNSYGGYGSGIAVSAGGSGNRPGTGFSGVSSGSSSGGGGGGGDPLKLKLTV